jgi:thiosulfate dehydrogenase [quinone] large subunit
VTFGELLIGAAFFLGLFTWIAAFFGIFMNLNYLLSESVAQNPIMLLLSIMILLAWRIASWWGIDRWALVRIGTPWQPGSIFQKEA